MKQLALGNITILAGANSSGKSTLIQSILLLAQTLASREDEKPLIDEQIRSLRSDVKDWHIPEHDDVLPDPRESSTGEVKQQGRLTMSAFSVDTPVFSPKISSQKITPLTTKTSASFVAGT